MLTRLLIIACLASSAVQASAADANFSVKGDRLSQAAVAPCDPLRFNCDPFNVNTKPPAPQQQQSAPAPATPIEIKNIIPPLPQQGESWVSWVFAAISGIATLLLGKVVFKPPALPGAAPVASGVSEHGIQEIISSMLHPDGPETGASLIRDPNLRLMALQTLSRVVQSGVPGQAIQTGASFIPGVGPLASTLEPLLRKIVTGAIDARLGSLQNQAPPPSQNPMAR